MKSGRSSCLSPRIGQTREGADLLPGLVFYCVGCLEPGQEKVGGRNKLLSIVFG